ncbi:hypothetical protein [Terracoccus luteus]|uniref:Uncharacterized protein n=1 Tax=Terracoccus luteus TaxID=53356 RepID=A0A839PVX4_9MICO|nr:hypothetical protein [Terracoccus luteus]MBB2987667.1 hypothetical protein [Terracoccus luteus]MCP2173318.1 hypothetical protein [Terracoccus luteus]
MDVEYIAGFGPVVTDSSASQAFWADAFGIVFDEVGPDYFHARGAPSLHQRLEVGDPVRES